MNRMLNKKMHGIIKENVGKKKKCNYSSAADR